MWKIKIRKLRRKARQAARNHQWDLAAQYYSDLCTRKNYDVRDQIQLGHSLKEAEDFDAALIAYLQAAEKHPVNIDAQRQAGLFLNRLGRSNEAAIYFARALSWDHNLSDMQSELRNIGVSDKASLDAYYLKGYSVGIDFVQKSTNWIKHLLASGLLASARIFARKKDWYRAENIYRKFLKFSPYSAKVLTQLGHCLREQNINEDAILFYRQALLLNPRDSDIYLHLGHALKTLSRKDSALNAYLIALKLRPSAISPALKEINNLKKTFPKARQNKFLEKKLSKVKSKEHENITNLIEKVITQHLSVEPYLEDKQNVIFKFLTGSLAYRE